MIRDTQVEHAPPSMLPLVVVRCTGGVARRAV